MSVPIEVPFADGNMNPVVRIGDEVRRSLPGSWRGCHAVLHHLAGKDFPYSPSLLRHDDSYEWLTYLTGESVDADLSGYRDDALLRQAGSLIRRYHDAMADFVSPPDAHWLPQIGMPDEPEVICHSDIAPWNVLVQGGEITGLIDWDLLHPGPKIWDLAYAAWRFAPLYDEPQYGDVREKGRRIGLLLDAYDLPRDQRSDFVEWIRRRAQSAFDTVEVLGKQGVAGYVRLYELQLHHAGLPLNWLQAHGDALQQLIDN